MRSVAVIGAGAAGLAIARYLAAEKQLFKFVIYEQESQIGGTWVYDDNCISLHQGFEGMKEMQNNTEYHSGMYKSLRTNLPKQVMAYPDFPFPENCRTFPSHYEVLKYLHDYSSNFGIDNSICFNEKVSHVMPLPREDAKDHHFNVQWNVKTVNTKTGLESSAIYDSVVICNGHFTTPNIPIIQGIENFQGYVFHSHFYRVPDAYKSKDVLVLGARSSGRDIAIEISKVAKSVILSHRGPRVKCSLPDNINEKPSIKAINNDGDVVFEDDSYAKTDAIVFCTGYKFNFPFLDESCLIQLKNERIFPLYKQIFNANYPSMAFIGLQNITCPCKLFSMQARWVVNVLAGRKNLPEIKKMIEDADGELEKRISLGISEKYFHRLEKDLQWEYYKTISIEGDVEPMKLVIQKLYQKVSLERDLDLLNYRNTEYKVINDEEYEKI